jgi:hypothetical protein
MKNRNRFNSPKARAFAAICAIGVTALVVGRADSSSSESAGSAASLRSMSPEIFDSLPGATQDYLIEHDTSDIDVPDTSLPAEEDRSTWKSLDELLQEQKDFTFEDESVEAGPGDKGKKKPAPKGGGKKKRKVRVAQDDLSVKFAYTPDGGMKQPKKRCELFMNEKGEYNSYGKIVKNYILEDKSDDGHSRFLSDDLVGMTASPKICPNWTKFDDAMKIKFWVWTFADIAYWESGCWAEVPDHKDINDYAVGLYQLERKVSNRASRGPNCAVSVKAIHSPYSNIRCAMDMIRYQLKPTENQSGKLYNSVKNNDSYFYWLRQANGGAMGRNIRYFKPCRS